MRETASSSQQRPPVRAVDSINHVSEDDRGAVVVASSHGGLYCAYKALTVGVRGVILNDAGVGRDGAGIGSLDFCERYGMPAAAVSYLSARIGDVADMQRRGKISHANAQARDLGIIPGMSCAAAIEKLRSAQLLASSPPEVVETRHEEELVETAEPVVCVDSASLVRPDDIGRVVITGSHGGLIGGDPQKAINVACNFAAFNDAGVGIDQAGTGRLEPLNARGIPAVTVGHMTARIGDGRSTLHDGIISHANGRARAIGATPGKALRDALVSWLANGSD